MKNKVANWTIIIIGLILIVSLSRSIIELSRKGGVIDEAQERVDKAEAENANLREKFREVKRPEYIEKVAREKLGLGKDGEVVVVLPKGEKTQNVEYSIENRERDEQKAVWRQWVDLFL